MRDLDVDTVLGRVRVRVGGAGPALLCWPSLLMDSSMWAAQAAHFSGTHQVIVVDPPGHGASAPLRAPFTFDDCARCVEQLLDALGVGRVRLLGNSWGGMIGGTFAARHPDRLAGAVLMNCTGSPAPARQRREYGFLVAAARLAGGIRGPLVRPAVRPFLGATTLRERPRVVEFVTAAVRRADVRSARHAVTSVVPHRPDQLTALAAVRSPVLVLAGAEDVTFPVPETRAMAEAIPGAAFTVLDRVGHLAALEDPDRVNAVVAEFLASLD